MFPAIAKRLLEAADHPSQVVSVSHPRAGFVVPKDVFDRFEQGDPDQEKAQEPVTEIPKRRPGRPRKNETVPVKEE